MIRTSNTARIAKAVIFLLLLSWVTDLLEIHVLNYLLGRVLELGLIALVVLFQPGPPRGGGRRGGPASGRGRSAPGKKRNKSNTPPQTVMACEAMAREKSRCIDGI